MKGSIIFFVLVMMVVSSPAFAVKKETKMMMDQLQKLEEIVTRLEEKMNGIAADTAAMSKSINSIEEQVKTITRNQADTKENKENLLLSLQFIKEELNELKNNVNKINDRLVSMPPAGGSVDNNGADPESQQNTPAQTAESTYYAAYSDYIKKNYQLAIDGFKQFIKMYPKHDLADNALYWIGECYYSRKMFQEAVDTFTELTGGYPEGDKIPDAILKKGYSLIEMGKQNEGIAALKELVSRFPLSEEASLAQQKIKEVTE